MFVFDTKIATVRPYLLLGSAQHELDYALLRKAGVSHILQVGSELRPSFPDRFEYLRIAVDDIEQEDIIRQLRRCFDFVNKARQRDGFEDAAPSSTVAAAPSAPAVVLVHCMAGMSRSASVVVAYLMHDEGLPYVDAFKQVKAARPCIYPNLGFLLQLWEWESSGCDLDYWPGWNKARFAERLAEYRRAQDVAGLHPAVRVRLPMSPAAGLPAPRAAAAAGGGAAAAAISPRGRAPTAGANNGACVLSCRRGRGDSGELDIEEGGASGGSGSAGSVVHDGRGSGHCSGCGGIGGIDGGGGGAATAAGASRATDEPLGAVVCPAAAAAAAAAIV